MEPIKLSNANQVFIKTLKDKNTSSNKSEVQELSQKNDKKIKLALAGLAVIGIGVIVGVGVVYKRKVAASKFTSYFYNPVYNSGVK